MDYGKTHNKILRDEALKRARKSDILHSSGLVSSDSLATGGASMTFEQRKELNRKYVGSYDKSKMAMESSGLRARLAGMRAGVQNTGAEGEKRGQGSSRFDAKIRKVPRLPRRG